MLMKLFNLFVSKDSKTRNRTDSQKNHQKLYQRKTKSV